MTATIERATNDDRAALVELNEEYIGWVLAGIERSFGFALETVLGMPLRAYVEANVETLTAYAPPRGVFYLVRDDGHPVGMGGLRPLADGACEIKRIYVRASLRGTGTGSALFDGLLRDARAFGYDTVRLDTAPFMEAARTLYEARGFAYRAPYAGVEVSPLVHDRWLFMERTL